MTDETIQKAVELHAPVIKTMSAIGFGLLKDGETFYQKGYELNPRMSTTFSMNQAYVIHNALTHHDKEKAGEVMRKLNENRVVAATANDRFLFKVYEDGSYDAIRL